MEVNKKSYEKYIKKITPVHRLSLNMLKAFVTGGIICTVGQLSTSVIMKYGVEKKDAEIWTMLFLVAVSVILSGFGIYAKIVTFGGAGALVPITGFANAVVSPAIEYKVEGQVYGIGVKIFTIAGPVILYGVFASWLLGIIYWIGIYFGIF